MANTPRDDSGSIPNLELRGTTYRVYRHMLRRRKPLGISDIQKELGLSSPSVAQYHVRKLLQLGLIKEEQGGYIVDKVVLENIIRIKRISVPVQTAYIAFFGVTLLVLLMFLRPEAVTSVYFFAVVVNVAAMAVSVYETIKTLRHL